MKREMAIIVVLSLITVTPSISVFNEKSDVAGSPILKCALGCVPVKETKNISIGEKPVISSSPLPSSWDWRNYLGQDWTTPAKSQGNCGSCWDFAALGALEAVIKIREGCAAFNPDLSEQYLLSCPPDSGGCNGWDAYYAYKYMYQHDGALLEDCFPYRANDDIPCSSKCSDWKEKLVPLSGYGYIYHPGRDYMKEFLVNNGPFVVDMAVYNDFFSYSGGIYEHPGTEPASAINHQVVLVGYDDSHQYWICKNSWGTWWGENGFFRIKYGDCQIEYALIYANYNPNYFDWPPVANTGGPYTGKPNEEITFDGSKSVDPDGDIVSYEWDFGDGGSANGSVVKHAYSKEGIYTVRLTVTDGNNQSDSSQSLVYVDETLPSVEIKQPREGCIYFFDREYQWLLGRLFHKPVIIGGITTYAQVSDNIGIEKVEFYIDNRLVSVDENSPYLYYWENATGRQHTIKVIAYDIVGNTNEESINVIRIG